MEEDEIQANACKFPRVANNARNESNKQIFPEGQEIAELRRRGGGSSSDVPTNRFHHSWHHHSSRIIRVSRASGGKDRHSKVMTSKGLRDRRVRLSVTTAIQFYDLQDRLGYDQPSKAVEWLIKAAGDAISELPSLNDTFPPEDNNTSNSKQASHERRGSTVGTEQGMGTGEAETQSQNLSWSNKTSAGSSTSDQTSKGSGLSLSRSEIRVKARERARERTAKEKENNNEQHSHHNVNNPISQTASFTELLTGGITSTNATTCDNEPNLLNKGSRQQLWCASATPMAMDYFNSGHNNNNNTNQSSGLSSGQIQYPQGVCVSPLLNVMGENQTDQLQHFSFIPDHLVPSDYNLNFTISSNSSGLAGFNRGTLQSNSPSLITHPLHRFSSPCDASNNLPFFIGAAAAPTMEMNHHHHHQFSPAFDGRLQLCYGDASSRHSDQKTKPKN